MAEVFWDNSGANWENPPAPSFQLVLVRPEDLLVMRVSFYNMHPDPAGAKMVRMDAAKDAFMAVDLPTQHRAESAVAATLRNNAFIPPVLWRFPRPVSSAAGIDEALWQARLVFRVESEVPLTWDGLLDWSTHRPVLSGLIDAFLRPRTSGAATQVIPAGPPGPMTTAINMPAGIWTSPTGTGVWRHVARPVSLPGSAGAFETSEIWHTVLCGQNGAADVPYWAIGYQPGGTGETPALTEAARSDFASVSLSQANQEVWRAGNYALSSLGGWFQTDVELRAAPRKTTHVAYQLSLGRDRSALRTDLGWLMHGAFQVRATALYERHFTEGSPPVAEWREAPLVIEVLNPVGRLKMDPHQRLVLKQRLIFAPPDVHSDGPLLLRNADGRPHLFDLELIDSSGKSSHFRTTLTLYMGASLAEVFKTWKHDQQDFELGGQIVHYAGMPETGLQTSSMTFSFSALPSNDAVAMRMERAAVMHPALDTFAGTAGPHQVAYPDNGAAPGKIDEGSKRFLSLVGEAPKLDFSGRPDAVGGIASPSMTAKALSVTHGVLSKDAASLPSPEEVFGGLSARLLGTLDLVKLIAPSGFDPPRVVDVESGAERAVRLDWDHVVTPSTERGLDVLCPRTDGGGEIRLGLHATISQPRPGEDPGSARAEITGTLTRFALQFPPPSAGSLGPLQPPLLALNFDDLTFRKPPNEQAQVTANLGELAFRGPLEFLNTLKHFIPPDGFSNPPTTHVDADGAQAGYSLALPAVGVGAFSLTNVLLEAGLSIPFNGAPVAAGFSFSRFENPFQVSVFGFAGRGYFQIAADMHGLQMLDAALEFGGALNFSFGPVQGGVSATGGVRLIYTRDPQNFDVSAYFRISGGVSLFCVGVSIDQTVALHYESSGCFVGEMGVKLTVHLAFFSKSFGFRIHKVFQGSPLEVEPSQEMAIEAPTMPSPDRQLQRRLAPTAGFAEAFSFDRWSTWRAAFVPASAESPAGAA